MNYSAQSINQFLGSLGSHEPAPGGGAAAALTAATAASLAEMVIRFNAKKHAQAKSKILPVTRLKKQLLNLLSLDAANFKKNLKAFSSPKESSAHQKALKVCVRAPLAMCASCLEVIQIAKSQQALTSRWLYSDLAESAILAEAAFNSARLNAEINLRGFTNQKEADRLRKMMDVQYKQIKNIKSELLEQFR